MEVRINQQYGCHVVVFNSANAKKIVTLVPELWLITDEKLCGYCGKGNAKISCDSCIVNTERWCSVSCRKSAVNTYHKRECNLFKEMLQKFGPSALKIPCKNI